MPLPRRPNIIVEAGQYGEHPLIRLLHVDDVLFAESAEAEFQASCGEPKYIPASPSCVTTSAKQDMECQSCPPRGHDGADGCVAGADDLEVGYQSAKPVREVDDLSPGDPGEEVLGAAGEAATSCGKTGPQMMMWS